MVLLGSRRPIQAPASLIPTLSCALGLFFRHNHLLWRQFIPYKPQPRRAFLEAPRESPFPFPVLPEHSGAVLSSGLAPQARQSGLYCSPLQQTMSPSKTKPGRTRVLSKGWGLPVESPYF